MSSSGQGATFCSFSGMLQIHRMESAEKAYTIILVAEMFTSVASEVIPEIDSPEHIQIKLEYFNDRQEQEFSTNAYMFCVGTLAIETAASNNIPRLSMKAVQLLV